MEQNFQSVQSQVTLEHLSILKNSDPASSMAVKLGLSIVGLFHEKLNRTDCSVEIVENNHGLNKELFSLYFEQPDKIMNEIQNAHEMINNNAVGQSHLRFVKVLIEDMNSDILSNEEPNSDAFKIIHQFLDTFIKEYESVHGNIELDMGEVFLFSKTASDIKTLKESLVTLNQIDNFKNSEEKKAESDNKDSQKNEPIEEDEFEEDMPE